MSTGTMYIGEFRQACGGQKVLEPANELAGNTGDEGVYALHLGGAGENFDDWPLPAPVYLQKTRVPDVLAPVSRSR